MKLEHAHGPADMDLVVDETSVAELLVVAADGIA
jgi:hypothetical protein